MSQAVASSAFRKPSVIPGFGLALGFTLTYLSLIVLIPLAALVLKTASLGWVDFWKLATDPRTIAALRTSFGLSIAAAAINAVFGLIVAWVLVRYEFPGRKLLDAFIDLPFALPTASRSPPATPRTAGSARWSRRSAGRSPTRRSAS